MNTRKNTTASASPATVRNVDDETFVARKALWNAVADAESDIYIVGDLIHLLHDHLTRAQPLTAEMQSALVHVSAQLYQSAANLRDFLHELHMLSGVSGDKPAEAAR